jgi:hypothetical protein
MRAIHKYSFFFLIWYQNMCQEILKNRFPAQSPSQASNLKDEPASDSEHHHPQPDHPTLANEHTKPGQCYNFLKEVHGNPLFSKPKQRPEPLARILTGYEILRHTCFSRHSWVKNLVDRHLTPSPPPNLTQIQMTASDITHLWHTNHDQNVTNLS